MGETFEWDERIQIGMTVEITGVNVKGRGYGGKDTTRIRRNFRAGERVKCMVLGRSYRYSGEVKGSYEDGRYMVPEESHPVWLVQPLKGQKYMKPFAVEQDQIVLPQRRILAFDTTHIPKNATITSAILQYPPGMLKLTILESGEGAVPELILPAREATDGEVFSDGRPYVPEEAAGGEGGGPTQE